MKLGRWSRGLWEEMNMGESRLISEPRHEAAEEYWGQSLKRPRIVCESQIESEARVWAEGEVWGEGSVSPQKIFENSYTWNRAAVDENGRDHISILSKFS